MLSTALGQDPELAGTLVQPTVEADEGAQLPDRVVGSRTEFCDRLPNVGALLG